MRTHGERDQDEEDGSRRDETKKKRQDVKKAV